MPFTIDHALEIDAPAETVWAVVTDLDAYARWNPFVIECRSTLRVGEPIDMKVRIFPAFTQRQRETIREHEPGRRISYGVGPLPFGALRSARSHEVHALDGERSRYESHFELGGWMAPIVRALMGSRLESGFRAMTDALARRSADLASRG